MRKKPNFVLMLHDNIGYGDPGCYGGGVLRGAPTPRIDAMASKGIRFTNFNVEAQCTPTRSAILTGRLPIRSGTSFITPPGHIYGLAPWEYSLASLLSDEGYRTALFGKWHLGHSEGRFPTNQGFDEWYGFPNSSDETLYASSVGFDPSCARVPYLWEGRKGEPCREIEPYTLENRAVMDEMITDRTVSYIQQHADSDQPFFLCVWFSHPHHPVMPHPDFEGISGNGPYADCMVEIDHRVGQVRDAIQTAGLDEDTVTIWLSDNGPESVPPWIPAGDTGPFRGELGTVFEGAIRVPCIVTWPDHIQPGQVTNEMVSGLDIYPTLATLAGAAKRIPTDRPMDGVDQSALLLGKQETSNRDHILFFIQNDMYAMKWKQFKVHFKDVTQAPGATGQLPYPAYVQELTAPRIYNIEQDPKELYDILLTNLWIFEPLIKIANEFSASAAGHPHIPTGGDGPIG